jgi:hypothetical protein
MRKAILFLTRRVWGPFIAGILCRAYSDGVISSAQLHTLAREFDPTQAGIVGSLPRDVQPGFAHRGAA